jgi:hypothetical protein
MLGAIRVRVAIRRVLHLEVLGIVRRVDGPQSFRSPHNSGVLIEVRRLVASYEGN